MGFHSPSVAPDVRNRNVPGGWGAREGVALPNNILRFWKSLDSDDPFEALFEAAPVLMHSIDKTGTIIRVSRFWASKLGYEPEEMAGRKSTEFLTEESRHHAVTVALPDFFRTGAIYNTEYDFVRKDGKLLPVLMSAIAQYDKEGNFVRSLAVMFDNTEAKRAAAELQRKQRMEAIGALVGGVAHDFNNLLAVILGNLEFLLADPDDPDRMEFIEAALNAARRGGTLTQQLLSYGRRARLSPEMIDLNSVVMTVDRMVRRLLPATIELETVSGAGLWRAEVDTAQLETAVLNIINNARDAMPAGGKLTLETSNVRIGEEYIAARGEDIQPGRYVMLAITDSGTGMDEATRSRIFDPFFTTKDVGFGSGLGLSMVFGFMRQSNGTIRVYSEPGKGTTFKLYFPAVAREGEVPDRGAPGVPAPTGGKLVLLAEDEDDVRSVLTRQMEHAGYRVAGCATGDEALRLIETGLRPDVLLTDIVMPGSLQGPELAKRARALITGLRVMFISGYPTEAAIHGNGLRPEDRHLIKPVGREALVHALAEMVGREDKG